VKLGSVAVCANFIVTSAYDTSVQSTVQSKLSHNMLSKEVKQVFPACFQELRKEPKWKMVQEMTGPVSISKMREFYQKSIDDCKNELKKLRHGAAIWKNDLEKLRHGE